MRLCAYGALLLLLMACSSREPTLRDQLAIPFAEPLVPAEPIVLPSPGALPPPMPFMLMNPKPRPRPESKSSSDQTPPPALVTKRRPECVPILLDHLGGDPLHDWCADTFPPNRHPGKDVQILDKRFDALQKEVDVLWEIKTDRFDDYTPFVKDRAIRRQVPELQRERDIAREWGYEFIVGVSSEAHK